MDRFFPSIAGIIAGFSLIKVPLFDFFAPLKPLTTLVGVLAVLIFSCYIIYMAFMHMLGKRY